MILETKDKLYFAVYSVTEKCNDLVSYQDISGNTSAFRGIFGNEKDALDYANKIPFYEVRENTRTGMHETQAAFALIYPAKEVDPQQVTVIPSQNTNYVIQGGKAYGIDKTSFRIVESLPLKKISRS